MKRILLVCALSLCILSSAVGEDTQSEIVRARNQQWEELTGQMSKGVTGGRFKAEALDSQALILEGDRDPLDIVLRRTRVEARVTMQL
jgi:hypothetical protein